MSSFIFSRRKWLFQDTDEPAEILACVEDFVKRSEKDEYEYLFHRRSLAAFVYSCNKLEHTLPLGMSQQDTFRCLESMQDEEEDIGVSTWQADGGKGIRTQMTQHLQALRTAMKWANDPIHELNAEAVCHLHGILMKNSMDQNGIPIKAGIIRITGAYTTDHVYPEASREMLEHAIQLYYLSIAKGDHFILSATILFYEIIQAHPFEDGNGRLCRILLAYALSRAGIPFPISLSSGHSKARKHYILAIQDAQVKDFQDLSYNRHLVDLASLVLKSCYNSIANYKANMKRQYSEMVEVPVQYPSQFMVVENDQGKYELTAKDEKKNRYDGNIMKFPDPQMQHHVIEGVRYAVVESRKYFSVRDTIMIVVKSDKHRASDIWSREIPEDFKRAQSTRLKLLQFCGAREKLQPCLPLFSLLQMIQVIPNGSACRQFRSLCANLFMRYHGGDPALVDEIRANADCNAFLNETAREELAHAQMDQIREEIREEREQQNSQPSVETHDEQFLQLGKRMREHIEATIEIIQKYNAGNLISTEQNIALAASLERLNPQVTTNNAIRWETLRIDQAEGEFRRSEKIKNAETDRTEGELRRNEMIKNAETEANVQRILDDKDTGHAKSQQIVAKINAETEEGRKKIVPVQPEIPQPVAPVPVAPEIPGPAEPIFMTLYDMIKDMGLGANMTDQDIDKILRTIGNKLSNYARGKRTQRGYDCNTFEPDSIRERLRSMFQQISQPVRNQSSIHMFFNNTSDNGGKK